MPLVALVAVVVQRLLLPPTMMTRLHTARAEPQPHRRSGGRPMRLSATRSPFLAVPSDNLGLGDGRKRVKGDACLFISSLM